LELLVAAGKKTKGRDYMIFGPQQVKKKTVKVCGKSIPVVIIVELVFSLVLYNVHKFTSAYFQEEKKIAKVWHSATRTVTLEIPHLNDRQSLKNASRLWLCKGTLMICFGNNECRDFPLATRLTRKPQN
jgi:hypothetical protein